MEIDRKNAEKPLRKLRKTLKGLPDDPSVEEVHSLRTQTRRLEAIVEAFMLDRKKKTRDLLKAMTPVRKAAGDVRDMDVFVGKVLNLSRDQANDSLVRLIEHLSEMRVESARELRRTLGARRKDARRGLKSYAKLIGRQFADGQESIVGPAQAPAKLATELAHWPALDAENVHDFRIRVKQLRYMLQLEKAVDRPIVEALGKVKDEVGDWHDWQELARIAGETLDPEHDRSALKQIEEIGRAKLEKALATTNAVREKYFAAESVEAKPAARKGGVGKGAAATGKKKPAKRARKTKS